MAPDEDDEDPATAYERLLPLLVVDDNADCRSLLAGALRRDGFRVVEACDGREALTACAQETPWMVILDNEMPRMSGIEVAVELAQHEDSASIPVMFVSGTEVPDGVAANVVARLTKPVKLRRLLELVRAWALASAAGAARLARAVPAVLGAGAHGLRLYPA